MAKKDFNKKIKTMEKIAEKQKTEKKEPIVLKDPAKSYHPEGNKTSLPITTTTSSSGGASLGVFGKNISQKVSETKESESKPAEPEKSETETNKKDENEKTENTETETKSSPEKAGEKVNFIRYPQSKIRCVSEKKSVCESIGK